jgi:hypothetical protein
MHKLSRMLDANVMKICYKNSTKYQLPKSAIDIKKNNIYNKYNFVKI